jgi:hypothetical protein
MQTRSTASSAAPDCSTELRSREEPVQVPRARGASEGAWLVPLPSLKLRANVALEVALVMRLPLMPKIISVQ